MDKGLFAQTKRLARLLALLCLIALLPSLLGRDSIPWLNLTQGYEDSEYTRITPRGVTVDWDKLMADTQFVIITHGGTPKFKGSLSEIQPVLDTLSRMDLRLRFAQRPSMRAGFLYSVHFYKDGQILGLFTASHTKLDFRCYNMPRDKNCFLSVPFYQVRRLNNQIALFLGDAKKIDVKDWSRGV